ncbi:hypothetical protein [Borreliella japonica]|uniref:hypothetical protein n=1 Tax=Borreliella japonica TaxID=34095 RepID=UPI003AF0BF49
MKKILILILIFSLKIQIFASEDKIKKDVGYIAATVRYENEKASAKIPFKLDIDKFI